jgi:hypothetical protein
VRSPPSLAFIELKMANAGAAVEVQTVDRIKNDTTADVSNTEDINSEQFKPKVYPKGWKLHALTAG